MKGRNRAMTNRLQLGDITIHRIVEQEEPLFDARAFFPGMDDAMFAENRSWLEPRFIDPASGKLVLCIQSYLVCTPHHNILIDSCVGNHKPRPRPFWNMMNSDRYERAFAATGLSFDDIDFVMCTHLHSDHVGWNTRLENGRWVPTFSNARYLFADRELTHWTARHKESPEAFPWVTDSVLPIVAANRADIVTSDHAMNDLVRLIPTPGHSVDHYSVHVGAAGHDAIITGDMIHSPIQARYPELGMMADLDSAQAGRSRRSLFGRFCDTSTLMCTAHFPSPSTGRIAAWDDGFKFVDA
jgi:glyoxylase-like metal-dependent hydrolase (beta-lactamase superfamily II)